MSLKKPSKNWYLAPIAGGVIGGIIAYYGLKDRSEKMAKRVLWIGVTLTAITYIVPILMALYDSGILV